MDADVTIRIESDGSLRTHSLLANGEGFCARCLLDWARRDAFDWSNPLNCLLFVLFITTNMSYNLRGFSSCLGGDNKTKMFRLRE